MIASRYKTRVWFLREEGGLLRPLYDGGGARAFIGFCAAWADGDPLPPRQRVGALLLTPSADCVTAPGEMRHYINYLWQVGDLACLLLGKEECIRRVRSLTASLNVALRKGACEYLEKELETNCE